jgi:hypothetical protein
MASGAASKQRKGQYCKKHIICTTPGCNIKQAQGYPFCEDCKVNHKKNEYDEWLAGPKFDIWTVRL